MRVRFHAVAVMLFAFALAAPAQPRVRMNIDDPKFDLEGYKIAVQVLKDRDTTAGFKNDPVNWTGNSYNFFAKVHNDFSKGGGCIHGSEVFLPWHRELLVRFELALRAAKPGRTDNITLPYWNWAEPPSGKAYPKAFEDPSSPLFSKTRNPSLQCSPGECPYTTAQIQQLIADNKKWLLFAGDPCKLKPNCSSGNCSDCPSGQYGAFESPYHNEMHDGLGTPMSDPRTAAQDPIFWSFHGYIDLVYQQWQCEYKLPPNCPKCNFRGMTDRRVEDVWDIERQLDYVYDIVPSCNVGPAVVFAAAPMAKAATAAPRRVFDRPRHMVLSTAAAAQNAAPTVYDLRMPEPNFETAHVVIDGLPYSSSFSYSGHVLLYPADVQLKAADADFMSRYSIGSFSVWKRTEDEAESDEHAGHRTASVRVDATHALRYLAQSQRNSAWKIAIVFDADNPPEAKQMLTFKSAELVLDLDPAEQR